MKSYKILAVKLTILPLFLVMGCQHNLDIQVQRISIEPQSRLQSDSYLGARVLSTASALGDIKEFCNKIVTSIDGAAYSTNEQTRNLAKALAAHKDRLSDISIESTKLHQELMALFDSNLTAQGKKTDIYLTLAKVSRFEQNELAEIRNFNDKIKSYESSKVLKDLLGDDSEKIKNYAGSLIDLRNTVRKQTSRAGFGGFLVTEVFEIRPSDPAYRQILCREKQQGQNEKMLSCQNISSVSVSATGDSSFMVVVENPTQVRVYQISNDPTPIMRNIALLTSKALIAIAKFANYGTPL